MESKWFLEKPDDFEEDYTAITCPVGRRCCVMAVDVSIVFGYDSLNVLISKSREVTKFAKRHILIASLCKISYFPP